MQTPLAVGTHQSRMPESSPPHSGRHCRHGCKPRSEIRPEICGSACQPFRTRGSSQLPFHSPHS